MKYKVVLNNQSINWSTREIKSILLKYFLLIKVYLINPVFCGFSTIF